MGGNLFPESKRIGNDELVEVLSILKKELMPINGIILWASVKSFILKPDHGDIDIIVNYSGTVGEFLEAVSQFADKTSRNDKVVSILWLGVQIDFLLCSTDEEFEHMYFYYSYNDLQNFVGKIYHSLNLSFGHLGLSYKYTTQKSTYKYYFNWSPEKIWTSVGLDFKKWIYGIKDIGDIIEFLSTSPYFNPSYFDPNNLRHRDRTRGKKRKNFISIVEYYKKHNPDGIEAALPSKEERELALTEFLTSSHLHDYYAFTKWKFEIDYKEKLHETKKSAFPSSLIHSKFGVLGEQLGLFTKSVYLNEKVTAYCEDILEEKEVLSESKINNLIEEACEHLFNVSSTGSTSEMG